MVDTAVKLELQYRQIVSQMKKCNLAGANALLKDLRDLDRTLEADEKAIRKALVLAMEEGAEGRKFADFEKTRHVAPALKALDGDLKTLDGAIKALQAHSKEAGRIHGDLSKLLGQVDKEVKARQQALGRLAKGSADQKTQAKALEGLEKFRDALNDDCNEMDRAADVALLIDKYLLVYEAQKDKVLKKLLEEAGKKATRFKLDEGLTDPTLAKLRRTADDLVKRTEKTMANALNAPDPAGKGAQAQVETARKAVDDLTALAESLRERFDKAKAEIKDERLSAAIEKKVAEIETLSAATYKHYKAQKAKLPH